MRYIGKLLITIITLAMSPAFGESYNVLMESYNDLMKRNELVERNDLFYKKFSNEPFSGRVDWKMEGQLCNAILKNGIPE